jgi:hypothetical protein
MVGLLVRTMVVKLVAEMVDSLAYSGYQWVVKKAVDWAVDLVDSMAGLLDKKLNRIV